MEPVLLTAIVGSVASIAVPILNKVLGRDPREDLLKDIKILQILNQDSEGFQIFHNHVEVNIRNFAKNGWIKRAYGKLYWRSLAAVFLVVLIFLTNSWSASNPQANWISYISYPASFVFVLMILSIAVQICGITYAEFNLLRIEVELRRLQSKIKRVDRLNTKVDKLAAKIDTDSNPKNADVEFAKIYNAALSWGLFGVTENQSLEALKKWPTRFDTDIQSANSKAFNYLDEWKRTNQMPQFKKST